MGEDLREFRDKVFALTSSIESRDARYRFIEMQQRLTELLEASLEDERKRNASH